MNAVITSPAGIDFGYSGDGGPATAAQIGAPAGVSVGSDGSVYISSRSHGSVRKVAPNGIITTVAGTGTPGFNGDVNSALSSIKATTLFIVSPQDQFFPPHYIEADVNAIPGARAVWINSVAGHLICCNGDPQATRILGEAIRGFLQELNAQRKAAR